MSSIKDMARKDWKRLSQAAFDISTEDEPDLGKMNLTSPDGKTALIKGINSDHSALLELDGSFALGNNIHAAFHEEAVSEANPDYPIRTKEGKIDLKDHTIEFDSKKFVIQETWPDETVGMIVCMCGLYGANDYGDD